MRHNTLFLNKRILAIVIILNVLLLSLKSYSQDVPLEPFRTLKISKADSVLLTKTWDQLFHALKSDSKEEIKKIALQKVLCAICGEGPRDFGEGELVPLDTFTNIGIKNLKDPPVWKEISSGEYKLDVTMYPNRKPDNFTLQKHQKLVVYDVVFLYIEPINQKSKVKWHYIFRFVKINEQFKFFGLLLL